MCKSKQDSTYVPEPPFPHLDMIRLGRLVVVPSITHPAFAAALQGPSVIFATHPSLRCGDVVHLVRVLGASAKNTLICTGASPISLPRARALAARGCTHGRPAHGTRRPGLEL